VLNNFSYEPFPASFVGILNNRLQHASRVGVVTNALKNKRNTGHWIRGVNNAVKALLDCDIASLIIHQSTLLWKLSALLVFWTGACRFPSKTVSSPQSGRASKPVGWLNDCADWPIDSPAIILSANLLELQVYKTDIADKRSYSFSGENGSAAYTVHKRPTKIYS